MIDFEHFEGKPRKHEPTEAAPSCDVEGCQQTKNEHDYLHSTHEYQAVVEGQPAEDLSANCKWEDGVLVHVAPCLHAETPRPEMGKELTEVIRKYEDSSSDTAFTDAICAAFDIGLKRAAASGTESAPKIEWPMPYSFDRGSSERFVGECDGRNTAIEECKKAVKLALQSKSQPSSLTQAGPPMPKPPSEHVRLVALYPACACKDCKKYRLELARWAAQSQKGVL